MAITTATMAGSTPTWDELWSALEEAYDADTPYFINLEVRRQSDQVYTWRALGDPGAVYEGGVIEFE